MSSESQDLAVKWLVGFGIAVIAILVPVVAVGLLRGTLDPTGTALMLGGLLTGIISGLVLRIKGNGSGGDDG